MRYYCFKIFVVFTLSVTPYPDGPGLTYENRFIPRMAYKNNSKNKSPPMFSSAGRDIIIVLRIILRLLICLISLKILMILSNKNIDVTSVTEVKIFKYVMICPAVEKTTMVKSMIFAESQK